MCVKTLWAMVRQYCKPQNPRRLVSCRPGRGGGFPDSHSAHRSELLLATLLVIMMITPATQLPDSGRMRMGNGETGTGRVIRLSVIVATQLHRWICLTTTTRLRGFLFIIVRGL